MTVKVTKPIKITEAVLTASSIPEPDPNYGEVEWEDVSFVDLSSNYSVTHQLDSYGANIIRSGNNGIFVSNDNGISYSNPFGSITFGCCVDREDPDVMYFTTASAIYKSIDGGASFSLLTIPAVSGILWEVSSMGSRVVVVGEAGICLVSNDSGSSFSFVSIGAESTKLADVDINDVYTLACDISGNVYYSFDDHSSWTKMETGYTGQLLSVAHHNGYSFISGEKGFLSVSKDAGKTWETITTHLPYSKPIYDIATSESGYLCIPGRVSGALVSTDLGATWIEMNGGADQASGMTTINDDCVFVDGYALGGHISRYPIYRVGDQCIYKPTHKKYQCVKNFTQNDPASGATGDANESWVEVGPTNKWAQFVDTISSETKSTSQYTFELKPNKKFTSVAFFGCSGIERIVLSIRNSSGATVQSFNIYMIDTDAQLEWELDDGSPAFINKKYIGGIAYQPGYYAHFLVVPKSGFESKLRLVSFGIEREIGKSVSDGMKTNYIDLSTYEDDSFGNMRIVKRPVIELNAYSALVEGVRIQVVDRFLSSLAGEFNTWMAEIGGGQQILTYGTYERRPTDIKHDSFRNYIATIRSVV